MEAYPLLNPPGLETSSATNNAEVEPTSEQIILEERLVETKQFDGYIVETYRQYEIHTDENGKVLKAVPTGNYDYIKYYTE